MLYQIEQVRRVDGKMKVVYKFVAYRLWKKVTYLSGSWKLRLQWIGLID